MLTKSCEKVAPFFCCKICDYNTSRKSSFDKHITTAKHSKLTSVNIKSCKENGISFCCKNCNKDFKSRVGLWKHNKICLFTEQTQKEKSQMENDPTDKQLIMMLLKDNSDLKNIMMEVMKNGIVNNSNNISNSNNKTFNLQFFLNETCKDAMNIMDFVDSVKLQLTDLEKLGEIGYVDGISNIIVKNLNALDIDKRPVHCTDAKREVLYIKDDDKWEKENENKNKIRKVIKKIAFKNSRMLCEFKEKHPDCGKSESDYSDQYNKLIIEAMGGVGDNDTEKEDKIIKKITKEVIINKENV